MSRALLRGSEPQCQTQKISTGFGKEAISVNNMEISFKWCWLMPIVVGDLNVDAC